MIRNVLRHFVARTRGIRLHSAQVNYDYRVYGTSYGGWPIIDKSLTDNSIVYSFGVGEDISFDLDIIREFGCSVWGFDPTPKCVDWIGHQSLPGQFHFEQTGLASKEGMVEFFPPANVTHVSYSAAPGVRQNKASILAPVKPLASIMRYLGHDAIDVLKMDIEGFEYGAIENILQTTIRPKQLLVEFHHGMYNNDNRQTREAVKSLCAAGYKLFYVADGGREYGFAMTELR